MEAAVSASVLSRGSLGSCASVLLSVEEASREWWDGRRASRGDDGARDEEQPKAVARFLFNAGEGAQRLCAQFRVKPASLRGILVTQLDGGGAKAAGVPGLQFALADAGSPALAVRGPAGIERYVESFQEFIRRRWPEVDTVQVERPTCHHAKFERLGVVELLAVTLSDASAAPACPVPGYCHWCVVDKPADSSCSGSSDEDDDEEDDDDEEEDDDDEEDEQVGGETEGSGKLDGDEPRSPQPEPRRRTAISYIVRCWAKIAYSGKEPVTDPERSPSVILGVVDCPSAEFIPTLVGSVHFAPPANCGHSMKVVFHLAAKAVVQDARYQAWMSTLRCKHVLVHYSNSHRAGGDHFPSSLRWIKRLRVGAPDLFPTPQVEEALEEGAGATGSSQPSAAEPIGEPGADSLDVVVAELMTRVEFPVVPTATPATLGHAGSANPPCIVVVVNRAWETTAALQRAELASAEATAKAALGIDSNELDLDTDVEDNGARAKRARVDLPPAVWFLGTGAAKPSKMRGCSAILVDLSAGRMERFALLDAGEGAFGQMMRLFGPALARQVVSRLAWVWVSHHHLDHHGGLGRILEEFAGTNRAGERLAVVGPLTIQAFLQQYAQVFAVELPFAFTPCGAVGRVVRDAISCRVNHCHDAFAVAVPVPLRLGGCAWLVYSGDTRPCAQMWRRLCAPRWAAYTALIHESEEATFDDAMLDQAVRKRHSTTGEALLAGREMGAQVVVLTHFSQRYPRAVSAQAPEAGAGGSGTAAPLVFLACDLMRLQLHDHLQATSQDAGQLAHAMAAATQGGADAASVRR